MKGRSGLGKESEEERKRKLRIDAFAIKKKHRREEEVELTVNFKMRVRNKLNDRQTKLDLCKSQRECEQLDKSKDILQPLKEWYWPAVEEKDEERKDTKIDESRRDEYEDSEKLKMITRYLRHDHFYCIWCGVRFNDCEDIKGNCPGDTFEDHQD